MPGINNHITRNGLLRLNGGWKSCCLIWYGKSTAFFQYHFFHPKSTKFPTLCLRMRVHVGASLLPILPFVEAMTPFPPLGFEWGTLPDLKPRGGKGGMATAPWIGDWPPKQNRHNTFLEYWSPNCRLFGSKAVHVLTQFCGKWQLKPTVCLLVNFFVLQEKNNQQSDFFSFYAMEVELYRYGVMRFLK